MFSQNYYYGFRHYTQLTNTIINLAKRIQFLSLKNVIDIYTAILINPSLINHEKDMKLCLRLLNDNLSGLLDTDLPLCEASSILFAKMTGILAKVSYLRVMEP